MQVAGLTLMWRDVFCEWPLNWLSCQCGRFWHLVTPFVLCMIQLLLSILIEGTNIAYSSPWKCNPIAGINITHWTLAFVKNGSQTMRMWGWGGSQDQFVVFAPITRLRMCTIQGLRKLSFLYHHKICCCYWCQVLSECGVLYQLCMICNVCSSPRLHTQYMLMKMINTLTLL